MANNMLIMLKFSKILEKLKIFRKYLKIKEYNLKLIYSKEKNPNAVT
jgi:hypothetical protein